MFASFACTTTETKDPLQVTTRDRTIVISYYSEKGTLNYTILLYQ